MDGNNSLKRLRRDGGDTAADAQQSRCALPDTRGAPGDYYLSCAEVNAWAKDVIGKDRINGRAMVSLDGISFLSVYLSWFRTMMKKQPVQVGGATWMRN
jgi:hypothetical protein